jgi:hypothetical protein
VVAARAAFLLRRELRAGLPASLSDAMIFAEQSRRQCGWRETCADAEVDR